MAPLRATFGEALLRAHRGLLKDLRKLRDAVRAASAGRHPDFAALLEATRADVLEHFRFEEQNGYMASVLEIQPHLKRTAEHLQEEHGRLRESLDGLVAEARSAAARTDEFRQKVLAWLQRVRRHEHSENALVQDAFNLDLSAED
jgi:hypothetical protein